MQYHQLLYASPPSYYNFLQKKKKKNHFQIVIYIRYVTLLIYKKGYIPQCTPLTDMLNYVP